MILSKPGLRDASKQTSQIVSNSQNPISDPYLKVTSTWEIPPKNNKNYIK